MTPEEALRKLDAAIDEVLAAADQRTLCTLAELGATAAEVAVVVEERDSELAAWRQKLRQRARTWFLHGGADLH
jgi:hypothetical protein